MGAPYIYIYDISRVRVKGHSFRTSKHDQNGSKDYPVTVCVQHSLQLLKKITLKYSLTADCKQSLIYITVLILQNTSGLRFKLSYVYTPDITLFLAQVASVLKPIKMTSLTSCKSPSTSNSPWAPRFIST